jgi:hypothetical protein
VSCTSARVSRLRKYKHAAHNVFDLELRWGGGIDLKTHTLSPGKSLRMPEKIGKEIAEDFKPIGDLCGTSPGLAVYLTENERHQAMIEALMIAEQHYHTVGARQMEYVRDQKGHNPDEVERFKNSTYSTYLLAMAKEDLIREKREELQAKGPQSKG